MFKNGQKNSLSSNLAVLTILFAILVELIILVPALSGYRERWLEDRINSARVAALALEAAPQGMISEQLTQDLLMSLELNTVVHKKAGMRRLLAASQIPTPVDVTVDLREDNRFEHVYETFHTLMGGNRTLRVLGEARQKGEFVEITMAEKSLRQALIAHGVRLLFWSTLLAIIVGAVLFACLNAYIVVPVRRLTGNMQLLSQNPHAFMQRATTTRDDEIGEAEHVFENMQSTIRNELTARKRLSNIGLSITKISHDLRNILSTAQLLSERLSNSKDITIAQTAPRLIKTLDRAIAYCENTLNYAKDETPALNRTSVNVSKLLHEARQLSNCDEHIGWHEAIEKDLTFDADYEAMLRVFGNLFKNAREAMQNTHTTLDPQKDLIRVQGRREGSVVVLEISDTGPGIPPQKQANIFEPFSGSSKAGGHGLGLNIAAELVQEHGGNIELISGTLGATFRISLPDRVVDIKTGRAIG